MGQVRRLLFWILAATRSHSQRCKKYLITLLSDRLCIASGGRSRLVGDGFVGYVARLTYT
jgi:hypothetical protein